MNKVRTRTDITKKKYVERAKRLEKKFINETGQTLKDSAAFVDWLVSHTTNKSFANWRQVKASCIYYLTQIDFKETADQLAVISHDHTDKDSVLLATSSRKKKGVTDKELSKINSYLLSSANSEGGSVYDKAVMAMFNSIMAVGLRPSEWKHAQYFEEGIPDIRIEPPVLMVKNGKATNGRSFGEYRYIGLSNLTELQNQFILLNLSLCSSPKDAQGNEISYEEYYERIRIRFNNVIKKLFPRAQKAITIYSARHQLIANLKASGSSLVEIACIVGHGNDVTATEHYGKKRVGYKIKNLPTANPSDLAKVRQRIQDKLLQRNKVHSLNKDAR